MVAGTAPAALHDALDDAWRSIEPDDELDGALTSSAADDRLAKLVHLLDDDELRRANFALLIVRSVVGTERSRR